MARFSARICYAAAVHSHGREYAARLMARVLAARLREGIGQCDAEDLSKMLMLVAEGKSLAVAFRFSEDGRPNNASRDIGIHDRIEQLQAKCMALNRCYQRLATEHGLSVSRVKAIHLNVRDAYWIANHPDED